MARDLSHWTRDRVCIDCGKVEAVRKDSGSQRCKPCGGRRGGIVAGPIVTAKKLERQAERGNCSCGKPLSYDERHCSRACYLKTINWVDRNCHHCGTIFPVLASKLPPVNLTTNARGKFCSRQCYADSMRGRSWNPVKRRAAK